VTAHRDVGFPTLATTTSSLKTAQAVVERLLSDRDSPVTPEWVADCFAASAGDVREMLFRLYDRWESLPA
jgi:pyruvate/oxaloacetate carboxyltransferase